MNPKRAAGQNPNVKEQTHTPPQGNPRDIFFRRQTKPQAERAELGVEYYIDTNTSSEIILILRSEAEGVMGLDFGIRVNKLLQQICRGRDFFPICFLHPDFSGL